MNFPFMLMILAWFVGVPALGLLCLRIYAAIEYQDSIQQMLDRQQGLYYSFPVKIPATLSVLSAAYLIAYYFG